MFFLQFLYIYAAARTLKEKSNLTSGDVNTVQHNKEAIAKVFKPKDEDVNVGGDVFGFSS